MTSAPRLCRVPTALKRVVGRALQGAELSGNGCQIATRWEAAIKQQCFSCRGGDVEAVTACAASRCALWSVRPWRSGHGLEAPSEDVGGADVLAAHLSQELGDAAGLVRVIHRGQPPELARAIVGDGATP